MGKMAGKRSDGGGDALLVTAVFLVFFVGISALLLYSASGRPSETVRTTSRTAWSLNDGRLADAVAGHSVALLSGHLGYDSGAVCPDGLREVDVNWQIARQVGRALTGLGASVQILREHDARLGQIRTELFLSLHSDSCINRSGFKAARWQGGHDLAQKDEDLFLACLREQYGAATGLSWSADTISSDMRRYYAFRYINAKIPAVILEMGFLGGDRSLLLNRQDRVVRGIVRSIGCFFSRKG